MHKILQEYNMHIHEGWQRKGLIKCTFARKIEKMKYSLCHNGINCEQGSV